MQVLCQQCTCLPPELVVSSKKLLLELEARYLITSAQTDASAWGTRDLRPICHYLELQRFGEWGNHVLLVQETAASAQTQCEVSANVARQRELASCYVICEYI